MKANKYLIIILHQHRFPFVLEQAVPLERTVVRGELLVALIEEQLRGVGELLDGVLDLVVADALVLPVVERGRVEHELTESCAEVARPEALLDTLRTLIGFEQIFGDREQPFGHPGGRAEVWLDRACSVGVQHRLRVGGLARGGRLNRLDHR